MRAWELDKEYFDWLCDQVIKAPGFRERIVLEFLFSKEFVWTVPNDDNRAQDGKDLRREFLESWGHPPETEFLEIGCSMFELLVGLSRRLAFEGDGEPDAWFWRMMANIKLTKLTDDRSCSFERVDDILDRVIWRTYNHLGHGGLFPLASSEEDQRRVELWYQMSAYLLERVD